MKKLLAIIGIIYLVILIILFIFGYQYYCKSLTGDVTIVNCIEPFEINNLISIIVFFIILGIPAWILFLIVLFRRKKK
jgi:hypothetical protein